MTYSWPPCLAAAKRFLPDSVEQEWTTVWRNERPARPWRPPEQTVVQGLNHITLAVSDADRSLAFYVDLLGLRLVARWPTGAYLLAGGVWLVLHQDAATRPGALPEYTHLAFSVPGEAFDEARHALQAAGVVVWQENTSEGASCYFLDPDGHKLEIHAGDLASRLADCRQRPWPGLRLTDETVR